MKVLSYMFWRDATHRMPWTAAVPIINGSVVVGSIFLTIALLFLFSFISYSVVHYVFFSHFHSNLHINCKDSVWLLRLSGITYTKECLPLVSSLYLSRSPALSYTEMCRHFCFSLLWLLNSFFYVCIVCRTHRIFCIKINELNSWEFHLLIKL